jgi:hypothetical protein
LLDEQATYVQLAEFGGGVFHKRGANKKRSTAAGMRRFGRNAPHTSDYSQKPVEFLDELGYFCAPNF